MTFHKEFWNLVDENQITCFKLAQIVNAPIKVLLDWYDNKSVTVEALNQLKSFLDV